MSSLQLNFRTLLLTTGLMLAGLSTGDFANAAPQKRVGTNKKGATNPYKSQVDQLRKLKHLLNLADRDYKGHRGQAVKDITVAIRALGGVGTKGKNVNTTPRGGNEPQAVSDAQLRQAISGLQSVASQVGGVPAAAKALNSAIKQLQIALTIK